MKKIIIFLFVCAMSFTVLAVNTSDFVIDEGTLKGDVNGDGVVTSSDVTALYYVLLNNNYSNVVNGDQTGDGIITAADVTEVYMILLNGGGGSTGGSVITMSEFSPNSGSSSGENLHQWAEGDVIFIAVDPDYSSSSACQNVYAMVRTGGKWVLQDVQGSNKQGFKTIGGTLCAAYVQHADLSNSSYNYIPLTGDVACVNRAANYTVIPKNGKFYIKINDIILYHFVSRIDVSGAYEGDYFYESVTHLDALTKITWMPFYAYGALRQVAGLLSSTSTATTRAMPMVCGERTHALTDGSRSTMPRTTVILITGHIIKLDWNKAVAFPSTRLGPTLGEGATSRCGTTTMTIEHLTALMLAQPTKMSISMWAPTSSSAPTMEILPTRKAP